LRKPEYIGDNAKRPVDEYIGLYWRKRIDDLGDMDNEEVRELNVFKDLIFLKKDLVF
jgi:hypothetical protein